MVATYIPIKSAPKCAPDAKAIVRISQGSSYRHYYVDGIADAKGLCAYFGVEFG